ncbi:DUF983 domain-containing protein [Erythrobacter sp. JK5]|nr:DUF983 domain-containing protein [Erythrobacter sp. JK5]
MALSCDRCGLDLGALERGARLAGLVTILTAAILIMLAIGIDIMLRPPLWLQVVIWAPLTLAVVIGTLRLYKTALLYRRYEAQAEQGGTEG